MKKIYSLFFAGLISQFSVHAQTVPFCDTTANVIIYSNYDGGTLNINVDKNIPNLKIGITTYEAVKVIISGAYAGNVTAVRYAGYNGTNDNCSQGVTNTSIAGVAGNLDTIILYPPAGYSNANGYPFIICNYSCNNTTSQGGCNTPDQIVSYFTTQLGGTLNYHHTQYNCWTPATSYSVSAGGNCCIMPVTGIKQPRAKNFHAFPNPATGELNLRFDNGHVAHAVQLRNIIGEEILRTSFGAGLDKVKLDLKDITPGIYLITVKEGEKEYFSKIVIE